MQAISIKSRSPETAIPILKKALEREKRILTESLKITKNKVSRLAHNLNVDIDKLMRGKVVHTNENDMDLIELEGEIEIARYLESQLKELRAIEICK